MADGNPIRTGNRLKDMTGVVSGRLTVISRSGSRGRTAMWECQCKCGNLCVVSGGAIRRGQKSCGCYGDEVRGKATRTHGQSKHPLYLVWQAMNRRCHLLTDESYHRYGARGISVCQRWRHDFAAFFSDMGDRPTPQHTLDRIDNNGNYEPSNCRWATRAEQSCNRRSNRVFTHNGESKCLAEWARAYGIHRSALYARVITLGWNISDAITIPYGNGEKKRPS